MNGEEMVCSMSSQLYHIPETENLEGLDEMHRHLYDSSYHRVTATGCAKRLQAGEYHDTIIKTMISCVQNALDADQKVMKWLQVMRDNAPNEFTQFIEIIIRWQQETVQSLSMAQHRLSQMGFEIENQRMNAAY
ncbi:hypothetical protein KS419_09635 [Bacillus tamaricis]|uniref:Uncharacterized protein n=2 Tax=Evansella tamaricis TaxID=2069301 RepID=A0ABS6JFK7_9BACI|nr:hypothetical protein [Evansella tamaricis]MBU9711999.1 hypothetical protein [Evansella tamaricis]